MSPRKYQPTVCRRPNCTAYARVNREQGYCKKHYQALPTRGYLPAQPVRDRITLLRARGLGTEELEAKTGITFQAIRLIMDSDQVGVQHRTYHAVMSIEIPRRVSALGGTVSTVGTRRRIEALAWLGYSQRELARRSDGIVGGHVSYNRINRYYCNYTILASNAALIADIYEALYLTPGPNAHTRRLAVEMDYAPPFAWDDETIDDPAAKSQHNLHSRASFTERYLELRDHVGIRDISQLANRMGIKREAVEQGIYRNRELIAS